MQLLLSNDDVAERQDSHLKSINLCQIHEPRKEIIE